MDEDVCVHEVAIERFGDDSVHHLLDMPSSSSSSEYGGSDGSNPGDSLPPAIFSVVKESDDLSSFALLQPFYSIEPSNGHAEHQPSTMEQQHDEVSESPQEQEHHHHHQLALENGSNEPAEVLIEITPPSTSSADTLNGDDDESLGSGRGARSKESSPAPAINLELVNAPESVAVVQVITDDHDHDQATIVNAEEDQQVMVEESQPVIVVTEPEHDPYDHQEARCEEIIAVEPLVDDYRTKSSSPQPAYMMASPKTKTTVIILPASPLPPAEDNSSHNDNVAPPYYSEVDDSLPRHVEASMEPQHLTIETSSSCYQPLVSGDDDDSHLKRHLENLQRVAFGRSRAEICRNCTTFDEAVARTQRDAVFSDQQMWRNLQFVIREKYTSFAKLEAISRIQEKIQELVGFVDSSILTNSCWSGKVGSNKSPTHLRASASPASSTKELPDDLDIMLQLFNSEIEASNALSSWLMRSVEATCSHLENAAKFYQFESELGHCFSWLVNSLEAASFKVDQLADSGYCNWLVAANGTTMSASAAASYWLSATYQEIENCTKLLNFWQDKVERLFANCRWLSPVNKRSPTQRGIYSPAEFFPSSSATNGSLSPNSTANGPAPLTARLLLDYNHHGQPQSDLCRGLNVNVTHMNSARSSDLPHYWQVGDSSNPSAPTFDVPNYVCELVPSSNEMQERFDVVAGLAKSLISGGKKLLASLHRFVHAFIKANFPQLDETRSLLLMGLDLNEKLEALNVIDETVAFVERTWPVEAGQQRHSQTSLVSLVDLLNSYRYALLNERKTSWAMSDDDVEANQTNEGKGLIVVVNVELLKQLLGKMSQLDLQWNNYAEKVARMGQQLNETPVFMLESDNNGTSLNDGKCVKCFANWNKFIDIEEASRNSRALNQQQQRTSEVIEMAVQTDDLMSIENCQQVEVGSLISEKRFSTNSSERPPSQSSSDSSTESDIMVHSEVAEERRHFTIKGVIKNRALIGSRQLPSSADLMSLREAITRGIVNPTAGTCLDLENLNSEPIPIPVAIERGFIVVEHQSEAEVLRREQKTEHVISRQSSRRYGRDHSRGRDNSSEAPRQKPTPPPPPPPPVPPKQQRPQLQQQQQAQQLVSPARPCNGTTIFITDNDTHGVVDSDSAALRHYSGPAVFSPQNARTNGAAAEKSITPSTSSSSTASNSRAADSATNKAANSTLSNSNGHSNNKSSNGGSLNANNAKTGNGADSKLRRGARTVVISRDKLNGHNKPQAAVAAATTAAASHVTSTAYIASAYVEDDDRPQQPQQNAVAISKSRTVMSMLTKQLALHNNSSNNGASDSSAPTTPRSGTDSANSLNRSQQQQQQNANLSPKTPVRSQVGARGSVRKIAKFFEQQ